MTEGTGMQSGRIDPAKLDAAAMPKRKRRKRNRREPAPELRDWEKAAEARAHARPYPPGIMLEPAGFDQEHWTAPHNDPDLWTLQLAEAFGTRSMAVISTFMRQLEALCRPTDWDESARQWRLDEHEFSALLAIVNTAKPRNELEAAQVAQMVAVHLMTMNWQRKRSNMRATFAPLPLRPSWPGRSHSKSRRCDLDGGANQPHGRQSRFGRSFTNMCTITGGTEKRNANPMDGPLPLLTNAPLCQARTRAGTSCRCPAAKGKRRCRLHGGAAGSGAPAGERNGAFRNGGRTKRAGALQNAAKRLLAALERDNARREPSDSRR